MVETAGRRLFGLHLKDFTFDRAGKHTDVVVGTGNLDLAALRDALNKASFEGCAVVEYEGDVNHPIPSVSECVRHLKAAVPEFA
jgi:sugar phosphate isomerase/epimerase